MAEKRKRSPNWLASEKNLLLELVQQHLSIVENKKMDGVAIKQKAAEWKIISDEYNSQTKHTHRTAENLRAQWESMKKAVKKVSSNKKMLFIQTGYWIDNILQEGGFTKRSQICFLVVSKPEELYTQHNVLKSKKSNLRNYGNREANRARAYTNKKTAILTLIYNSAASTDFAKRVDRKKSS